MTRKQRIRVYQAAIKALWQLREEIRRQARSEDEARSAVAEFKAGLAVLQASYARW